MRDAQGDCARRFAALDTAIDALGVRDAATVRVPGHPYVRVDRVHAALAAELGDAGDARAARLARWSRGARCAGAGHRDRERGAAGGRGRRPRRARALPHDTARRARPRAGRGAARRRDRPRRLLGRAARRRAVSADAGRVRCRHPPLARRDARGLRTTGRCARAPWRAPYLCAGGAGSDGAAARCRCRAMCSACPASTPPRSPRCCSVTRQYGTSIRRATPTVSARWSGRVLPPRSRSMPRSRPSTRRSPTRASAAAGSCSSSTRRGSPRVPRRAASMCSPGHSTASCGASRSTTRSNRWCTTRSTPAVAITCSFPRRG